VGKEIDKSNVDEIVLNTIIWSRMFTENPLYSLECSNSNGNFPNTIIIILKGLRAKKKPDQF